MILFTSHKICNYEKLNYELYQSNYQIKQLNPSGLRFSASLVLFCNKGLKNVHFTKKMFDAVVCRVQQGLGAGLTNGSAAREYTPSMQLIYSEYTASIRGVYRAHGVYSEYTGSIQCVYRENTRMCST